MLRATYGDVGVAPDKRQRRFGGRSHPPNLERPAAPSTRSLSRSRAASSRDRVGQRDRRDPALRAPRCDCWYRQKEKPQAARRLGESATGTVARTSATPSRTAASPRLRGTQDARPDPNAGLEDRSGHSRGSRQERDPKIRACRCYWSPRSAARRARSRRLRSDLHRQGVRSACPPPGLKGAASANRSGDQLVGTKLDRLGRSLERLIALSDELERSRQQRRCTRSAYGVSTATDMVSAMAEATEARATRRSVSLDVERLELTAQGSLVIEGRWYGVRGRRFVRPALMLSSGGERRRLLADVEHKPWAAEEGELWQAAFPWSFDQTTEMTELELSVAPDIVVPVAPSDSGAPSRRPDGSRPRRSTAAVLRRQLDGARKELAGERERVDRLHAELERTQAAKARSLRREDRRAHRRAGRGAGRAAGGDRPARHRGPGGRRRSTSATAP